MELRDYRAVLRRRWPTVVLTVGVFMLLAAGISASRTPVYETSIDLYVLGRNADGTVDYTAGLLAQDRASTYARLIPTRRVAEAIVKDLGVPVDPGALSQQLDGRAIPDSVLVEATVRDTTPEGAQAIANSLARVLPALVGQLEGGGDESSITIVPLGSAPLPAKPVNVPSWTLLVIGGMLGLVAGLALALVHHRLDPTVRTLDDLAPVPASVIGIVQMDGRRGGDGATRGHDERFGLVRLSLERLGANTRRMLITTCGPERREAARAVISLARAYESAGQAVMIVDVSDPVAGIAVFRADDPAPRTRRSLPRSGIQALLDDLPGEDSEVVVVYGPPLLTSVDGVQFTTAVNSVLLVVHGGRSRKADVREAVRLLTSLGVPVWLLFIEPRKRWHRRPRAPRPQTIGRPDEARPSGVM